VIDLDGLDPIQRTLVIPLVGRARAHEIFPELGFRDPCAASILARSSFRNLGELERDRKIVWGSILRTQAFDAITAGFLARFPGATVINLGVGLCTRAARFPSARWIEVDVPAVIDARDRLLAPSPSTTRIAIDLGDLPSLERALALAVGPTLVLAEGVTMFLDRPARDALFARLGRLPRHSRVAFDFIHPIVAFAARLHRSMRATGARYRSGQWRWQIAAGLRVIHARGFRERLRGSLRVLHALLTLLALSPPYEIACLEAR
jgi:O-methyltransferase involved in polyketide biosynthesis